jgi:hypothetical protein
MAKKKLVMRVGALALMGGAMALYAAQAGVLPGLDLGSETTSRGGPAPLSMSAAPTAPGVQAPAALAAVLQAPDPTKPPDAFVQADTIDLPETSGFADAPVIAALPAIATEGAAADIRPAAFNPSTALPLPGAPVADVDATAELSPFGLPCGLDVSAEATDAAMIALGVAAPCHPNAAVTITHSGLAISLETDSFGLVTLDLPALASPAYVTVTLPDGEAHDIIVPVPDLDQYDRVALAWRNDLGVELHVMENGAAWMSEGHVHPSATRNAEALEDGRGFMTLLGDPTLAEPMLAQVYTLQRVGGPADAALSVDAPVTVANCSRAADLRLLRTRGAAAAEMVPLSFTYPTCDAVGDTLVLQNVFGDLRLAAN